MNEGRVVLGYSRALIGLFLLVLLSADLRAQISVPEGFSISKVADDSLATNIYSLTIDSDGKAVVAGPGYIKRLVDENQDGVFESAQLISKLPKNGAQGLCFSGRDLLAVGDEGVLKLSDSGGNGFFDTKEVLLKIKTGGEHDAHALRRGVDGRWYLLCGNGVPLPSANFLTNSKEISKYRRKVAGFLLEIESDFQSARIERIGFRNAYDFDFNSQGEIFTYDSDGERDLSLPWYQPTRVYRLPRFSDAGWISASWKHPDYSPTMPVVLGRHGRGSPTGVVCYDADEFGADYSDAIFALDWTVGRILVHKKDPATGKYDRGTVFAEPTGTAAFAVTDCEVARDGSLLVSVGGRGTEGSVYRISRENALARIDSESKRGPLKAPLETAGKNVADEKDRQVGFKMPFELEVFISMQNRFEDHLSKSIHHGRVKNEAWPAMFDGYFEDDRNLEPVSAEQLARVYSALRQADGVAFYEWCRRLALTRVSDPNIRGLILDRLSKESDPVDDIHYLNCLVRCAGRPSTAELRRMIEALLSVRPKLVAAGRSTDRNWPARMRELTQVMVREFRVSEMIANHPAISLPENFYLLEALEESDKQIVEMQIADAILQDPQSPSGEQLRFLSAADSNIYVGLLRSYSDDPKLRDSVIRSLARSPIPEDRQTFVQGFKSANREVWRLSAIGLRKLKSKSIVDVFTIYQKATLLGSDRQDQRVSAELLRFLQERFRDEFSDSRSFDLADWDNALSVAYPEEYRRTKARLGKRPASLQRLLDVDLTEGNRKRGESVYQRLLCAKCHDGSSRLGPDLKGVGNRFSSGDILKAIVEPDAQIPERYRALKVLTVDGETFLGSVVYESAEGIVMTDRQTNTIRIAQDDIEARGKSDVSLMPSGLLEGVHDQDIQDLMAYLRSLK